VAAESLLQVAGLGHRYGDDPRPALEEVAFHVAAGEVVTIVGPSGCGKSTLLRAVAGLLRPTQGRVVFDGKPVERTPEGLAMVFQDYSRSLFPWLRVRQNVEAPLRGKLDRAARADAAMAALADVGLADHAADYPWELSGGMQQRVAIARALVQRPDLLLMDEPFASVDAQTRADLEDLVLELHARIGVTVLLVTHDIDEAIYLADRVVVLSPRPGRVIEQVTVPLGRPRHQLETKADAAFVALRSEVLGRVMRREATS
jgi:NitT/TauT family transport system ATP-binding protein